MFRPLDPAELKYLNAEGCDHLLQRVRELIISTVSRNGGHFASSLGTVELTLAILRVFDFAPDCDAVVWDVGHQTYAWKILTGRSDSFAELRREDGLAGFPKRQESPYDYFNTGHASTSISAAQGLARAKRLQGHSGKVLAVIGDGALTGGLAYEAMNNLDDPNLIVILNDNQMSIDENVGTLKRHLSELRINPAYLTMKDHALHGLCSVPVIGDFLLKQLMRLKSALRIRLNQRASLFEKMGFRYYGPIDGHDLPLLERYLKAAKRTRCPVLLHVITQKGRGYKRAERIPQLYHGVSPFAEEEGISEPAAAPSTAADAAAYFADSVSYTQAFSWALRRSADEDQRLVAITAAMASGTGLQEFARSRRLRFYDVGIAESHAVTFACGLAAGGLRPVVAVYATFLQRALDNVFHDAALQNLPIFFAVDRAGLVGEDGETHQGIYDLNFLEALPNLEIWTASDPLRLALRMRELYRDLHGPVMLRYARGRSTLPSALRSRAEEPAPQAAETFRRFRFEEGSEGCAAGEAAAEGNLVLLTYGNYTGDAVAAVRVFLERCPEARVTILDVEKLKPVELAALAEDLRNAVGILIAEENSGPGPLARTVLPYLYEQGLNIPLIRRHLPLEAVEQGTRAEQLARYGMDASALARDLEKLLEGEGS